MRKTKGRMMPGMQTRHLNYSKRNRSTLLDSFPFPRFPSLPIDRFGLTAGLSALPNLFLKRDLRLPSQMIQATPSYKRRHQPSRLCLLWNQCQVASEKRSESGIILTLAIPFASVNAEYLDDKRNFTLSMAVLSSGLERRSDKRQDLPHPACMARLFEKVGRTLPRWRSL